MVRSNTMKINPKKKERVIEMVSIPLLLMGCGGVGRQLLHHIISCRPLHLRQGVRLRVVGVCDSKSMVAIPDVLTSEFHDDFLLQLCQAKSSGSSLQDYFAIKLSNSSPLSHSPTFSGISWYNLSSLEVGLITSGSLYGALIGSILAFNVADFLGRRRELLLSSVMYLVGALVTALAATFVVLVIGRITYGIGIGLIIYYSVPELHAAPMYIAETSPSQIRGQLISLKEFFIVLGMLFRECPLDLKEGISSVIFAAPRCSEIPELMSIRDVFQKKFGKDFVSAATDLRPNAGVNRMLIEKLSVKTPPGEVKLKVLKEIAKEYQVEWDTTESEEELLKPPEEFQIC